ncbi:MAG: hypothetical protein ACI30O_04600 [Muribaculaceae bacterium]
MSKLHHIYLLIAATLSLALGSCSSQDAPDDPNGNYGTLTDAEFSITAKDVTAPGVGGEFRPEAPQTANELIHKWTVVFVDNTSTVRAIVSGGSDISAIYSDVVRTSLHTGTYTAYAFANYTTLGETFGVNPTIGASFNPANMLFNTGNTNNPNALIPMTGTRVIKVTGRVEEPEAIEVIRSMAKVEFTFANLSQNAVTINSVEIEPAYTGRIPLFRDPKTATGYAKPVNADANAPYASVTVSNLNNKYMPVNTPYTNGAYAHVYLAENNPDYYPAQTYTLRVNMSRDGKSESDEVVVLTDPTAVPFMNRNDYIQIPISISDWIIDFDVLFYPPIGGYPAVQKFAEDKQLFFTFGSMGKFAILPKIKNAADGSPFLQPKQYDITITPRQVSDGMFIQSPSFNNDSHEIIGELSGANGRATFDVNVNIHGTATSLVYSRSIIIICQK